MDTTKTITEHTHATTSSPWRSAGLWITGILLVYMIFSSVQAANNPESFAASFGLPLGNEGGGAFVQVYAIRAFFLGVLGLTFLVRKKYASLATVILVAIIMPIGDFFLVAQHGADITIIARHGAIACILLLTWYLLQRWLRTVVTETNAVS